MAKNKYYVVWKGLAPGVYDNWGECKAQVDKQDGAKYKAFETEEEAVQAFEKGYEHYLKTASSAKAAAGLAPKAPVGKPIWESLCVDAACSGNPGRHGIPGRLSADHARDLPDRAAKERDEQHRRVPGFGARACLAEAEREQPADLFGQPGTPSAG